MDFRGARQELSRVGIGGLPPELIVHCCRISASASSWAAMCAVSRSWNTNLKVLPRAVWMEWALQRFLRLAPLVCSLQSQTDVDWKQMYREQLAADRHGVNREPRPARSSFDDFIFSIEIWTGPEDRRRTAFEWAGRLQEPALPNGRHFLRLWDPATPPAGEWIEALKAEMAAPDGQKDYHRVDALHLKFSLWVSRLVVRATGERFMRTVQLADSKPLEDVGSPDDSFDFETADLPDLVYTKLCARADGLYPDVDGYQCRATLNLETGMLTHLIQDSNYDDLNTDQILLFLDHSVPWESVSA